MPLTADLFPNANGDNTQWSQGGTSLGSAYLHARGRDLSWRTTAVLNKEDLFQLDDLPVEAGFIVQVDLTMYARQEDAFTNCNVAFRMRLAGNDYTSADQVVTGYDWTAYTVTNVPRPGGGPWTAADLNALQLGYLMNENGKQRSVDQVKATVTYLLAPSPNTGYIPREAPSQKLNTVSRPVETITFDAPLFMLDRELLDGLALSHRRGPAAASLGPGWKTGKTNRRPVRIVGLALDLNSMTVGVTAVDRRAIDCTVWDEMITSRASSAEAQGIARILHGGKRRALRSSGDYVEDPSDGTIRQILTDGESIAAGGTILDTDGLNIVTRSAFKTLSGGPGSIPTGWTQVMATVSSDAAVTWWDPAVTGQSLKLVSGAVNRAEASHGTAAAGTRSIVGSGGCRVSISYVNDTVLGSRLVWQLQRSSDSNWFRDSDGTWQVAVTDNFMATSTFKVRAVSANKFVPASAAETFTLHVLAELNATMHVFDAQIDDLPWATSRILSDGSAGTRAAAAVFIENFTALRQDLLNTAHFTLGIEFSPDWNGADMSTALFSPGVFMVADVGNPRYAAADSDRFGLFYDPTAQKFTARLNVAGTDYSATSPVVVPARGDVIRLVARATGADAELGLAARTLSCFAGVNGATLTKGTDVARPSDEAGQGYGWIMLGCREASVAPANFSGMTLHLRADKDVYKDNGVTLAVNNDTVQLWKDQSGAGRDYSQATAGKRPTFKTAIINGRPVLRFASASSTQMDSAAALSTMIGAGAAHFFVVVSASSITALDTILDDSNHRFTLRYEDTVTSKFLNDDGAIDGVTGTIQANAWYCIEGVHVGGNIYTRVLGTQSSNVASGNTNLLTGTVTIGGSPGVGRYINGDIAEVAIFNAELTAGSAIGSLNHFQEYIQRKYAIPFTSAPLPVGGNAANGTIRRLRITQHVLADDELTRLF